MNAVNEADRNKARALLIKAKSYRMFAIVFAMMGFAVFVLMYIQLADGDFFKAVQNPFSIFIIIFPFLPAFFLSRTAQKAESDLQKLLSAGKKEG